MVSAPPQCYDKCRCIRLVGFRSYSLVECRIMYKASRFWRRYPQAGKALGQTYLTQLGIIMVLQGEQEPSRLVQSSTQ